MSDWCQVCSCTTIVETLNAPLVQSAHRPLCSAFISEILQKYYQCFMGHIIMHLGIGAVYVFSMWSICTCTWLWIIVKTDLLK